MSHIWYKRGTELLEEIEDFRSMQNHVGIWYIGQMGMVFVWKGKVLCVDPVLGAMPDAQGADRRNYPAPFSPEEFSVDYVFCTHGHADHLHGETLQKLAVHNPSMKIFVPKPLEGRLQELGIFDGQIFGLHQSEPVSLDGTFTVRGVATAHEEYHFDEEGYSETMGYVFHLGPFCLFHSGDTVVTQELIGELKPEQGIDVLMVPINGRDMERHSRGIIGNMDSREACWFGAATDSDLIIPLHYDMIGGNEENPLVFADYMERLYPDRKYHIMRLGERLILCGNGLREQYRKNS